MRLWHKDLIDVLPQKQLVAQWRECCAIARNIAVKGSPNHILVNRIMDYPINEFWVYSKLVFLEMRRRGYLCDFSLFTCWFPNVQLPEDSVDDIDIFSAWHTKRYMYQCYSNLEEKHDCGGIPDGEWMKIEERMKGVVLV